MEFFGHSWEELTVEAVRAFLAGAGDEGLTWEAKGGADWIRTETARKAVAGLANRVGGHLIVGANRAGKDGPWTLDGQNCPHDEPQTWLTNALVNGISPTPVFDIKIFELEDGKTAAVVSVEPISLGPCLVDGVVFQRQSGITTPVRDAVVLSEMLNRGAADRRRVETSALEAAVSMLRVAPPGGDFEPEHTHFATSLAPAIPPSGWLERVFRQSFGHSLLNDVLKRRMTFDGLGYPVGLVPRQDGMYFVSRSEQVEGRVVRCAVDGTLSFGWISAYPDDDVPHDLSQHRVSHALEMLVSAARHEGASGDAVFVCAVNSANPAMATEPPVAPILRWINIDQPIDDVAAGIGRAVARAYGNRVFEPERPHREEAGP